MRKKIVSVLLSLTLAAGSLGGIPAVTAVAEEGGTITAAAGENAKSNSAGYKYIYAALTWDEFWKSEGVYGAGDTSSSAEKDGKGELDKGAFDAVTRATSNHGLHRGSFQSTAVIYDENQKEYKLSHWDKDDKTKAYLTDGTSVTISKGVITTESGTYTIDHYVVNGIKYVPTAVKEEDYEAFCAQYDVVENGSELNGGYGENALSAYYGLTADVTKDTNGLKEAVRNADGTFSFESRRTGTESGIKDTALAKADNITVTVKPADGAYGEFLRVDLNGEGYGALGAKMQAVKWTYYGDDSTRSKALASYGTKFAADNWMHKSNGIQLGLTDSLRCQLPEGTYGAGYWSITVYALGYEDYTFDFEATAENIVFDADVQVDTADLAAAISKAKTLNKKDYTAKSWADLETELAEAEEEIAAPHGQAVVNEAKEHLLNAIDSLVAEIGSVELNKTSFTYNGKVQKPSVVVKDKKGKTVSADNYTVDVSSNKKVGKYTVEVTFRNLYSGSRKLIYTIKPKTTSAKISSVKKNSVNVSWKKVSDISGYEVQYSTSSSFKKASTVKASSKAASVTVKKLGKNKKYYVRVRTYKKVSGKNIYSDWSSKVSARTKK